MPGQRQTGVSRSSMVPGQARLKGSWRSGLLVSRAMALANAGARGGRPGAPMPVGGSALGTTCTAMWGMSVMRGTTKSASKEAHDLQAEVDARFTEGFDTADLQEAKALLGGASVKTHPRFVHPAVTSLARAPERPCS